MRRDGSDCDCFARTRTHSLALRSVHHNRLGAGLIWMHNCALPPRTHPLIVAPALTHLFTPHHRPPLTTPHDFSSPLLTPSLHPYPTYGLNMPPKATNQLTPEHDVCSPFWHFALASLVLISDHHPPRHRRVRSRLPPRDLRHAGPRGSGRQRRQPHQPTCTADAQEDVCGIWCCGCGRGGGGVSE